MRIEEVLNRLHRNLKNGLGAWDTQKLMAPPYREKPDLEVIQKKNPKLSAVMILLYEKEQSTHVVLTQRHQYDGVHSGQISFPGGRHEQNESMIETAIRECDEEVGIALTPLDIITTLSEVYIPPSNFLVTPVLAYLKEAPSFVKQESEVASILELALPVLFDPMNKKDVEIQMKTGMSLKVPAYVINQHIIWGATAVMLSEFEQLLLE